MDTQRVLDQLINASKTLKQKGEDLAADKLGVGDDPESRDTMRKGAVGGALAAGVLALLVGTKAGRSVGGAAVRLGGLAALGGLAYNAYKNWMEGRGAAPEAIEHHPEAAEMAGPEGESRAQALLAAMIAAAKSDGHIDPHEQEAIEARMQGLEGVDPDFVRAELSKPVDPEGIAALATDDQARREIYAISAMVIDISHPAERLYMNDLAKALGLEPHLARRLEAAVNAPEAV